MYLDNLLIINLLALMFFPLQVLEIHNLTAELGLNNIKPYKLDALKSVNSNIINGNLKQTEDIGGLTSQGDKAASFVNGNLSSPTAEEKICKYLLFQ